LPDNYSGARLEKSLQDNVIDLKKELYIALQDSSEIVSYNAKLQDRYEKQEKKIN
ncbi:34397_t:CDS:2, partial [Racocetra persica]